MSNATFEDHSTNPEKVILRKKPYLDKGADYEHGFIDGMQHQMQSSVDKAVNAMAQRTWVGLTDEERKKIVGSDRYTDLLQEVVKIVEAKLKEKNT